MAEREYNTTDTSLLPTLLLVLFIGLKLTGYINWPWLWVLAPLWIPLVIALLCVAFYLFCLFMDKRERMAKLRARNRAHAEK